MEEPSPSSTLTSIALAVECTIDCARPAIVSKSTIKELLALHWVSQMARRRGFWARVSLAWELVREVFQA